MCRSKCSRAASSARGGDQRHGGKTAPEHALSMLSPLQHGGVASMPQDWSQSLLLHQCRAACGWRAAVAPKPAALDPQAGTIYQLSRRVLQCASLREAAQSCTRVVVAAACYASVVPHAPGSSLCRLPHSRGAAAAAKMVQRLTYRRRHCYNSASNRTRVVKTPGERGSPGCLSASRGRFEHARPALFRGSRAA
jgi:hypothetical protein